VPFFRRLPVVALFLAILLASLAPAAAQDGQAELTAAQEADPIAEPEANAPCAPTPPPALDTPAEGAPVDTNAPSAEPAPEPVEVQRPPELAYVNGQCMPVAELSRLLAGYEGAVAEEAQALTELREQLDRVDELNDQLDAVELSLAQVTRRDAAAEAETRFAGMRETLAGEELVVVREELDSQRNVLREQAVAAYVSGGDTAATVQEAVLEATDLNDIGSTRAYGRVIIDGRVDQVLLVQDLEAAAAMLEAELASARDQAAEIEKSVAAIRERAEELRDEQRRLVEEAQAAAEGQAQLVASIQQRRDSFAGQLGLSGASGGGLATTLAGLGSGTASLADVGTLASPLTQTSVSSGFGPRLHPIFAEVRIHAGLDLNSPAGAPIYAAAAGTVVVASEQGGYGMAIAIDHGGGIATLYAHQSAFAVNVGTEVETGDLIGYVGSTGFSTGPHLHFELRLDGQPVDPLPFVDLRNVGAPADATATGG
jgi:murein DD-endopeptidase MepM/ murein hydrolase activator NlpD